MRMPVLFGVIAVAIVLALGAANALVVDPSDQSAFVAPDRQGQTASTGAELITGRSALIAGFAAAEASSNWPRSLGL